MGPCDLEEQRHLSEMLNGFLEDLFAGQDRSKSWLALFKAVDTDGSGLLGAKLLSRMAKMTPTHDHKPDKYDPVGPPTEKENQHVFMGEGLKKP